MDSENAALRKEMHGIYDTIESSLQRRDEKMLREAIAAGEKHLPRISRKPAIAEFYSKLGNAHSD
jgi:hypothetical protein